VAFGGGISEESVGVREIFENYLGEVVLSGNRDNALTAARFGIKS